MFWDTFSDKVGTLIKKNITQLCVYAYHYVFICHFYNIQFLDKTVSQMFIIIRFTIPDILKSRHDDVPPTAIIPVITYVYGVKYLYGMVHTVLLYTYAVYYTRYFESS